MKNMFSHVMIGGNDIDAAKKFYDATLGALGYRPGKIDAKGRLFYFDRRGVFSVAKPLDGQPACGANGGTIGFAADDEAQANAWHKAGLENGGTAIEDPPGMRINGEVKLYLAYLRDPSGNKVCANFQS